MAIGTLPFSPCGSWGKLPACQSSRAACSGKLAACPTIPQAGRLCQDVRIRVVPLTKLALELARLVDNDLAFIGAADRVALQRPGRRALEVHAGDLESRAVTRALELLFRLQPVRRAAQVRAGGAQRVDDV